MCDRLLVTLQHAGGGADGPISHTRRPVAIDLFAGAGGLTLGFEQAGFDVVAAVEYDPVHAATHKYNFPSCEVVCRDAARLTAPELLAAARRGFERRYPGAEWPGRIDAVIGGPPCQGFSIGGKRLAGDERNQMLLTFVRLVVALQPSVICLENVAGLLETRYADTREQAFGRLRGAGFRLVGTESAVNARDFGVPQARRRVVILGARDGLVNWPPESTPAQPVTVGEALEGLPILENYQALLSSDVAELDQFDLERRRLVDGLYARVLSGLDSGVDLASPRTWLPSSVTSSRRTVHTAETLARFRGTAQGEVEPKSRLFRLSLDGVARTLRAGTGSERGSHTSPRPIHPTFDRVITVREAGRLHGYPDWFRFHTTNWHGHRQVGNSVPPPLGRSAGSALVAYLRTAPGPAPQEPAGDPALLSLPRLQAMEVLDAVRAEVPSSRSRHAVSAALASVG